jgi:hypothetical protein
MNFLDFAEDPKKAQRRPLYLFLLATLGVGALVSLFTPRRFPPGMRG